MKELTDKEIAFELRKKLIESVRRNRACGILFSGGLDSAVLASIKLNVKAITVNLKSYGKDVNYAASVAKFLNDGRGRIEHYQKSIDIEEAIEAIPEVIKMLKTFDPAIPNDLVIYFGLKLAKELGIDKVMTGDGSDELFAGYNFMQEIDDLEGYIRKIPENMRFSSNLIGNFFDIKIVQPFLNKKVIEFALSIRPEVKLKRGNGKFWGKWILRKAFEDFLPKEIIWQSKRALEIGSGMTKIREIISSRISDAEFKKNSHPVTFINKEHFYYYRMYKDIVGDIPKPNGKEKECIGCGAGMCPSAFHCEVCGYTADWRI